MSQLIQVMSLIYLIESEPTKSTCSTRQIAKAVAVEKDAKDDNNIDY